MKKKNKQSPSLHRRRRCIPYRRTTFPWRRFYRNLAIPTGGSPDPQASALLDPALQSPIPRHRTMDPDPETQRPNVADTLPERQIPLQPAEKQAPAATPQDAPSPATGLQAEDASGRPEPAREGPSAPVHGPKAPHHGFAPAEASRQPAPSSRGPEGPGAPVWVASASRRQGQASETPPATEPPLRQPPKENPPRLAPTPHRPPAPKPPQPLPSAEAQFRDAAQRQRGRPVRLGFCLFFCTGRFGPGRLPRPGISGGAGEPSAAHRRRDGAAAPVRPVGL